MSPMQKKFKIQKNSFITVGYVALAFMILLIVYMLIDSYPYDDIADFAVAAMLLLCWFILFIILLAYQSIVILISDSEMIQDVLLFKKTVRFDDVKECYVVNNRVLSLYLRNGKEIKYRLNIYEDLDGLRNELRKHIKIIEL